MRGLIGVDRVVVVHYLETPVRVVLMEILVVSEIIKVAVVAVAHLKLVDKEIQVHPDMVDEVVTEQHLQLQVQQ
jgi:hypothetical protein